MAALLDEAGAVILDQRGARMFDSKDNEETVLDNIKERYTLFQLANAAAQVENQVLIRELVYRLGLVGVTPSLTGYQVGWLLSDAQTGSGTSDVFDFGNLGKGNENVRETTLLRVTTTVGATPTCTYAIQGSVDNSNWFALSYSDSVTPEVFTSATFTITSATTVVKAIKAGQLYRYVRVTYSANTNVTNNTDIYPLGDVS